MITRKDVETMQKWLRGTRARVDLLEFVHATMPEFETAPHHKLIASALEQVQRGEMKRLYIGMPPRHGKSELASVRFPAWVLGRNPKMKIIHVSYSAALSNEFSRQVRAIIRDSDAFRALFPRCRLSGEKQAVTDWLTTEGGGFRSVGVGGGISGHGADLMIIDDPLKEGDADSMTTLESIYQWYATAARTRLSPQAAVVFIMTRWHPQDLIGRLLTLASEDAHADQWQQLVLPALAEENDPLGRKIDEALWRERYDEEALAALRAMSERQFQALFQQKPRASETVLFNAADFRRDIENAPLSGRSAWVFDLAITENEASDYSAWARVSECEGGLCFRAMSRMRAEYPKVKAAIVELMQAQPFDVFVFPKQTYELLAVQELKRLLPDMLIKQVTLKGDKRSRAATMSDLVASNKIWVDNDAMGDWFVNEHAQFTGVADLHDEAVDLSSLAVHYFGLNHGFELLLSDAPARTGLRRRRHELA